MSDSVKSIGMGNIVLGSSSVSLVMRDGTNQMQWDSRVHSGDYFTTLATELENLIENTEDMIVQMKLKSVIAELEYIQGRYEIKQKHIKGKRFGG